MGLRGSCCQAAQGCSLSSGVLARGPGQELVEHPERIDAGMARAEGGVGHPGLVDRLRRVASQDGHGLSVMCGGFSTDAQWSPSGPVRGRCGDSGAEVVPSVAHVAWDVSILSTLMRGYKVLSRHAWGGALYLLLLRREWLANLARSVLLRWHFAVAGLRGDGSLSSMTCSMMKSGRRAVAGWLMVVWAPAPALTLLLGNTGDLGLLLRR